MAWSIIIGLCLLKVGSECFVLENNGRASKDIIEMDIKIDHRLKKVIENAMQPRLSRRKRNAVKYHQRRWKNAIIPYIIDDNLGSSIRNAVMYAMDKFHKDTCLWFTPRRDETDYIRIVSGEGCYSKVGRQGGEQIVSIGPGCEKTATVMHELMHAIGFFHENSRYDRDQFVKVLWWNIKQGAEKNFLTYHHGRIDTFSMPYDINSLMHYDNKAFTKNRRDTMQAKDNPNKSLGGSSLSSIDLKQILLLYKCKRPKFKIRKAKCKDEKESCIIFLGYPSQCSTYKSFTMTNCKKTCRVCDPTESMRSN